MKINNITLLNFNCKYDCILAVQFGHARSINTQPRVNSRREEEEEEEEELREIYILNLIFLFIEIEISLLTKSGPQEGIYNLYNNVVLAMMLC